MSNVPAKNKTNGKTSKVNVIQRTTTETLRLTDSNCNSKGRTTEMSNQPPRKKPTSSFQVTGVSVISADAGDDSTDDLEESRTDETSISDDTYSKETDEAHLTQNISTIPSSISSVPSAVISSINCSNTSVATASSSDTAEGLNVSSTSSKKFSDRFKVVKVESTVPFYRGRWTCMDYLDHSVHTPKDAYVYCQHQQQYVKASSQLVQTSSVPNTVRQGQSCSLLQQTSSQSIPAQSLQIQQSNEILNVQDGNNQQNLIMQTVQIQNNSDSVAQTPVQNRVQIENIQQPIEAIMLNEEQLPDVSRMQLPPANVIAQNAYQQLNPGNIYSPCPFTPFQSVPTLYNQPCHGILPPMDFHPTSFRYDLPWLIYAGMSSPVGVRYVPPPTQQITQSVPFLPVLPNECTYAHLKPPQACMSQSFVPSFENGQSVSKNIPPKGERRPETTTAAFTMKENLTSVTATIPAYAQSMCQMTQPSYSEKIISKELIDNKDVENPVSTTHGVSNTHLIEVPVPPVTSSVITVSSTSNNDISVSSVQTNNTCVAAKKVNNNTSVASHQITKSSASSEDTESVSGGSTVAIDNKIAQAMDLVKSHLMYAVREEVEVLKERISELLDRINQLEVENSFLRANASAEVLSALNDRADESQQEEGPNKYSTTNNTHGGLN